MARVWPNGNYVGVHESGHEDGDALQRQMTGNVMARHDSGAPEDPERPLLMAYVTESTLSIYRQRVAVRKVVPIDRLTELAVRLVCHGAL